MTRAGCVLWAVFGVAAVCCGDPDGSNAVDFLLSYCIECHAAADPEAGFDLEALAGFESGDLLPPMAMEWERVLKRIRARQMPLATL